MIIKELFAKLGLTVDESGFVKAELLSSAIKKGLEVVGDIVKATAVAFKDLIAETVEYSDRVDKLSSALGVSSDKFQELAYAASVSSVDTDSFNDATRQLISNMRGASSGTGETAEAFQKLGVRIVNADGSLRNADEVILDIADSISGMSEGASRAATVVKIFGESGSRLTPFLVQGRSAIEGLAQEAHDLGAVLDRETITKNVEFADSITRLSSIVDFFKHSLGSALIPLLLEVTTAITQWFRVNGALIKQKTERVFERIAAVLRILLIPLQLLVKVMDLILDLWKLIAVILASVVAAALTTNAVAVFALGEAYLAAGLKGIWAGVRVAAAWVAANAPLIAMTLIFALIILLIDDVVVAMKGGKSVLKEWIQDWTDDPGENWFLRDMKALAYLLLNMGPIWDFWKGELQKLWDWMKEGFANTWDDIVVGVKAMFGIEDDRNKVKAAEASHYAAGFISDMSSTFGPGEWKDDGFGGQLWYPFADVSEAALSSLNQTSSPSNSFVVNQSIMATPNQSASEVASEAVSQMEDWHQTVLTQAASEM